MTSTITRGFFEDSEIHNKGPAQIAFDLDALSESDYGLTLGHLTLNVPAALPPGQARPFDAECARGASSRSVQAI